MRVTVYADCIGWHKYSGHPTLGHLHRHIFKVWATFGEQVSREVEFFDAQREVKRVLESIPLYLEAESSMSCEDIAKVILQETRAESVRVSEDGENYVDVTRQDLES